MSVSVAASSNPRLRNGGPISIAKSTRPFDRREVERSSHTYAQSENYWKRFLIPPGVLRSKPFARTTGQSQKPSAQVPRSALSNFMLLKSLEALRSAKEDY